MDSCGIIISEEFFMKITRSQLRKLINEVMVGYPDERAPFDADAALKSAKKKMKKDA